MASSIERYEKLNRIGEGTYGTVYRARDREGGGIVALKRVILHNEAADGFPITALREVKLLKRLRHPHCVRLLDMAVNTRRHDGVFLVFEYCEHDLSELQECMPRRFTEAEVKRLLLQLLGAVGHLHARWIIHRDIKMSNLLYNNRGELKLADFGLAREFSECGGSGVVGGGGQASKGIGGGAREEAAFAMTPKVVTLWYRAPELLLGEAAYGLSIDLWSVGCIFGELLQRTPLLPGSSVVEQLERIQALLGAASERIWPGLAFLPLARRFAFDGNRFRYNNLARRFSEISPVHGVGLLDALLTYDPARRITAAVAARHPYFEEKPLPAEPTMMPTFPSLHTQPGYRGRHQPLGDAAKGKGTAAAAAVPSVAATAAAAAAAAAKARGRSGAVLSAAWASDDQRFGSAFGSGGGGGKRARHF
jgi:serine/threonine protein kinase